MRRWFAGLRIPQWRNRSVPMAEYLLLRARGAHLSLTLARTQRPPQRSRCAGLQAPSSRSGSPTQLVRRATLAESVVRLTRRRHELEIPRRTSRMTLPPYPQSAILLFVRLPRSQNEARQHTRQLGVLDDVLPYETRQLRRLRAVARREHE